MKLRRVSGTGGMTMLRDAPARKAKQQLWNTTVGRHLAAAFGDTGARLPREQRKFGAHTTYQLMYVMLRSYSALNRVV